MDPNDKNTNPKSIDPNRRVIGLDAHPGTFTAALIVGQTPAQAETKNVFHKVPMKQLSSWALKHSTEQDIVVLEASGNSFQIVRTLKTIKRQALVLESCQMGKLKEAHANNDKLSAVRIGKAYLAGTAKEVWVPDPQTQERRDLFHIHRKGVKRTCQMSNRIGAYLSDNGAVLECSADLLDQEKVLQSASWSSQQRQFLEGLHAELLHARQMRQHWESLIAQAVLADAQLLSLVRLCGVRDVVAFSLGAIIGDIDRFASHKQLVKYIGLNPAFDNSGEGTWQGGIGGHGRKDLRALLIESAHSILRTDQPLGKWGRQLMARKSAPNIAVAAVARKLLVSVWYLMKGRSSQLTEIDPSLALKVGKIIGHIGEKGLKQLGKTRKGLRADVYQSLKSGPTYILDPNKKMPPPHSKTKDAFHKTLENEPISRSI
jgi:transposase